MNKNEPYSDLMSGKKLYRDTLFNCEFVFGLDSIQGYLEYANSNQKNISNLVFSPDDQNDYSTPLYRLKQLEREGYIDVKWALQSSGKEQYLATEQMCLSTSGQKLLDKLKTRSKAGQLKSRLINIFWAIITSAITTLIILHLQ